jgi:hypothetical protein
MYNQLLSEVVYPNTLNSSWHIVVTALLMTTITFIIIAIVI